MYSTKPNKKQEISSPTWGSLEERCYLSTADIIHFKAAVLLCCVRNKRKPVKKNKQWAETGRDRSSHALHPVLHTWSRRHLKIYYCKGRFLVLHSSKATSSELLKPLNRSFLAAPVPGFIQNWSESRTFSIFAHLSSFAPMTMCKTVTLPLLSPCVQYPRLTHDIDKWERFGLSVDLHLNLGPVCFSLCAVFQVWHEVNVNMNSEFIAHGSVRFIWRYRERCIQCCCCFTLHFHDQHTAEIWYINIKSPSNLIAPIIYVNKLTDD